MPPLLTIKAEFSQLLDVNFLSGQCLLERHNPGGKKGWRRTLSFPYLLAFLAIDKELSSAR